MIDDDIRALREALADGPTPGPWEAAAHGDYGDYDGKCRILLGDDMRIAAVFGLDNAETNATADFIAAASPDRIARLLDEVERLRAALTKANNQAEHFEREWYLRGDEIERLRSGRNELEAAISNALPGVRYMDPPDGGSPSLAEQLLRMAEDAERYLWLRRRDNQRAVDIMTSVFESLALDSTIDAARKEEGE